MIMNVATRSRLKILHLVSGDLWAGAETMACTLLKHLMDYDGLEISVIVLNEGRLAQELQDRGLNVRVINEHKYSFLEIFRKIRTLISKAPPDIIHSHRYKENFLTLLISGCCRGIRRVATQHGLPECDDKNAGLPQRLKNRANALALSRFFTTVAVSADIRNVLVSRCGFYQEQVEVIHNGIELPPSPSPAGRRGPFVIGSSGRLFPVKDYPLMVEIARAATAAGTEDIRFELAGDGPDMAALTSLVQSYGLKAAFTLRGHQDDMFSFYRGLDIYLNTSVHEGIPMTILEALAHGLPVIAPAVGGIVEIIDNGIEGFLIDSRMPGAFSEKCLFLKGNQQEHLRMARAAREKAETAFSAGRMAGKYNQLYRRLAAPNRLRPVEETATAA